MLHEDRRFGIFNLPDDLSEALAEFSRCGTWTLCTGFRWRTLLLLNDSLSEDGAQEYAIVREATGEQLESLTVSWMTTECLGEFLVDCLRDDHETWGIAHYRTDHLNADGYCQWCA